MTDSPIPGGDASVPEEADRAARVEALIARLENERLEVLPFYHDLRNQIVRPLNVHVETRYFFRQWKPKLGPVLTLLIMELRDRCYYNPRTGERRDYCWPSQEELARAIGVSVRTIIRALQSPLARRFIRIQHRYRYDPALGKKVRTSSAYVVAMDDPLRPEDEPLLARLAAEQILAEETTQRHLLQASSADDQTATLSDRCPTPASPDLTANLSDSSAFVLSDKLSSIDIGDKLADEEGLSGRDPHQKKKGSTPSSALPRSTAPLPAESLTPVPEAVLRAYADANARPPTPLEEQRLRVLIERFEPVARQARPPSTGAAWVLAAILEAVDSGSAYVAPRRIATICERWQRQLAARSARQPATGSAGHSPPAADPGPAELAASEPGPPVDPFAEEPAPAIPTFVVSAARPMTSGQLWQLVSEELRREPMLQQYRTWLAQASLVGQTENTFVVGVPTQVARDLLEERLGNAIARAITRVLGAPATVRVVVTRRWLAESEG